MRSGCVFRIVPFWCRRSGARERSLTPGIGPIQTQFRVREGECGIGFNARILQARLMVRPTMTLLCLGWALASAVVLANDAYNPLRDRHLPAGSQAQVAQAESWSVASRVRPEVAGPMADPAFEIPAYYNADTVVWQDAETPAADPWFIHYGDRGNHGYHSSHRYQYQYSPYPWADRIRKDFAEFTGASLPTHRRRSPGHHP